MTLIIILLLLVIIGLLLLEHDKIPASLFHQRRMILDSCALIDGRIRELVGSGFVTETLVIPKFVLAELQLLADGSDTHKRARARYGLDVARDLQQTLNGQVLVDQTLFPSLTTVDDKLIVLAKKLKATLYTTDLNLNKVATVEGVKVLNINELAQQLRPSVLPGEPRMVKLTQKGANSSQGIGHLEDGTMVVVENGANYIGRTVPVTIAQMRQTVAGRMLFAKLRRTPADKSKS